MPEATQLAAIDARVVSLHEAARRTGYATSTIRRWIKTDLITGYKGPTTNSPWKVDLVSLEVFLRQGAEAAQQGSEPTTLDSRPLDEILDSVIEEIDLRISIGEIGTLGPHQRDRVESRVSLLRSWLRDVEDELEK